MVGEIQTESAQNFSFSFDPHRARGGLAIHRSEELQIGKFSFKEVIEIVSKAHPGMVYSVKPKLIYGKALVEVLIFTASKKSKKVYMDLLTGQLISGNSGKHACLPVSNHGYDSIMDF